MLLILLSTMVIVGLTQPLEYKNNEAEDIRPRTPKVHPDYWNYNRKGIK